MKDHEPHPEVGLRNIAAWVWVAGILLVAGIIVFFLKPPAKWDLGDEIYFPSGWVIVSILLLAAVAGAGIAALLRDKAATEGSIISEGHPHPGITMHRLRVGGNAGGLIFAIGIVLICLVGIPTMWFFLGLAIVVGLAIALLLRRRKAVKILTIGSAGNRSL